MMKQLETTAAEATRRAAVPSRHLPQGLPARARRWSPALAGIALLAMTVPAQAALTLKPASVTMAAGTSALVQISGAAGQIQAESKNTAIVTVALSKVTTSSATLTLKGVASGSAVVYVRDSTTPNISLPVTVTSSTTTTSSSWVYKILATNDLGMHCVDADFSVFSMLPPYNVVNAQVVRRASTGKPAVVSDSTVSIRYVAVKDGTGSVNSTSRNTALVTKSNFWSYALPLYGAALAPGQGLKNLYMPADAPSLANRSLSWNSGGGLFKAEGVPILPVDDLGHSNRYPMLRLVATEKTTGKDVAFLDVVLPVSEETTCVDCHATGMPAATDSLIAWSSNPNLEIQSRENVLKLHDKRQGTTLLAEKPVLCASCHYSPALDLAGSGPQGSQLGNPTMSAAMHAYHSNKMVSPTSGVYPDTWVPLGGKPDPDTQACYTCHPGKSTQCLRGAMTATVNCQNCHGGMAAVGGKYPLWAGGSIDGANDGKPRRPWADLPRCQSCHTGDALNHWSSLDASLMASDGIRALVAFDTSDPAASPRLATNPRFAENTDKLYRFSKGHSGIACEGCHNSTHAIWENSDAAHNDNITAKELQGHTGTISECSTCHAPGSLALTLNGPHGMHNVGDSRWTTGHESLARANVQACAACHGKDYHGTVLSRTAAIRTWNTEYGTRTVAKGQVVGCYDCHRGPNGS
jgi:hypothetical protein